MPSVRPDLTLALATVQKLQALFEDVGYLRPRHRQLVAELMLVRLALTVENFNRMVVCKLCCGAPYMDGSAPALVLRQTSIERALGALRTTGMPTGKQRQLHWTDGPTIRESVEGIVDDSDPLYDRLRSHAATLTELRHVRNNIVHKNRTSRVNFQKVVTRYYGAKLRNITPGTLLTSDRFGPHALFTSMVIKARAMIREVSGSRPS